MSALEADALRKEVGHDATLAVPTLPVYDIIGVPAVESSENKTSPENRSSYPYQSLDFDTHEIRLLLFDIMPNY